MYHTLRSNIHFQYCPYMMGVCCGESPLAGFHYIVRRVSVNAHVLYVQGSLAL